MTPAGYSALSHWTLDPTLWVGMALFIGGYLAASGPLRARFQGSAPVERAQTILFLTGAVIMLLALVSPLDEISDEYLFSTHMVQHILLTMVAPPFVLLGTPGWMIRPLLRSPFLATVLHVLTNPLIAFALFNLDFMVWHVPFLYEATLENTYIHIFEHLLFMGTAFLNWWPILSPLPELPRLPEPAQILYLFLDAVPSTVLGAILIFAGNVLYPTYATAPRIFGIGALDDQLFSGLIMAMPGAMIYMLALSIVFFRWMGRDQGQAGRSLPTRP